MDTTILEVVLGLALIYAVLSVLVMKIQEEFGGNLLNYRSNVLHDLVLEACGHSEDLKQQVLKHPLVFALYREQEAEQRFVLRDKGPSAIPPALFAKALLAVLNGGTAPAPDLSPALFVADKAALAAATAGTSSADSEGRQRVWTVLQSLLPGNEASWPGFEAAIAGWFSDIGDRSDGWFKRKASRWALSLSLLLVVALNVDSFHIANTLARDPDLRLGLADLATRIDSQRRSDAAGTGDQSAPPGAAAQPMQQLASRMTDAITRLNSAFADEAIGRFQGDLMPVRLACSIVLEPSALDQALLPMDVASKPNHTGQTGASKTIPKPVAKPIVEDKPKAVVNGLPSPGASLSNADVWLRVLPIVQAKAEVAQLLPAQDAERIYRRSFECVAQVSSWVRSATVYSSKAEVRTQMQDAAAALESVKSALLTLVERQPAALSLRRAFVTDPDAFNTCRDSARGNRSAFDACLQRELKSGWNLPLFWGGSAMRQQFCSAASGAAVSTAQPQQFNLKITLPDAAAKPGTPGASATAVAQAVPLAVEPAVQTSRLCGAAAFAGDARLGLPALRLEPSTGWPWTAAILGWLTTVMFVALGAPFWFDLISKVVRLRSAGTVRDAAADEQRGRGTLPLPAPVPGSSGGDNGEVPFSDARNDFEHELTVDMIVRLQQKLPADQTGRLDQQTRNALRNWCSAHGQTPTEELTRDLYWLIVGRATTAVSAGSGSARPRLDQPHAQVPALAAALMPVLRQNGRIGTSPTVFGADLRALVVLFRYHRQRREGKAPQDCPVLRVPDRNPQQLDEVDEGLAAQIEAAASSQERRTLEPPCWMDWAIGELGQVEKNATSRAGSNPRILAYLDAFGSKGGDLGDNNPWCGGFVAWVLESYDKYRLAHLLDDERDGDPLKGAGTTWTMPTGDRSEGWPLKAEAWRTWGKAHADWKKQAVFGDVVRLKSQGAGSSGHVGFFIRWDGSRIWMLGGNQTGGSRVSMQDWDGGEVVEVRHADLPAAPPQAAFDPGI